MWLMLYKYGLQELYELSKLLKIVVYVLQIVVLKRQFV